MCAVQYYDANEVFAEVLRGNLADVVVCEDNEFLAFVDTRPHAGEHVAIIAKSPITRFAADQDEEMAHRLSLLTSKLVGTVCRAWNASGVVVTAHNDLAPYPPVDRLHVLILPQWTDRPEGPDACHVSKTYLSMLARKLATAVASSRIAG